MFVHYVEDNDLDALLMTNLTRKDSDLKIEISRTLKELEMHLSVGAADCVLLDLMRPDSTSLEDDVKKIREFSDLPVVFITSSDGDYFRKRAIEAGAEALIEKAALSSDVLKQIFYNATSRPVHTKLLSPVSHRAGLPMDFEPYGLALPNVNLDRLSLPLRFMQDALGQLRGAQKFEDRLIMEDLEDLTDDLRTFAQSNLAEISRIRLDDVLTSMNQKLAIYAGRRGVILRMMLETCSYDQVGPSELASIGINRVISGFLIGCGARDSVFVRTEKSDDGARLHIQSSRKLIEDRTELFDSYGTGQRGSLGAVASLQVGVLLLGLSPEQVEVTNQIGFNCLTLHL